MAFEAYPSSLLRLLLLGGTEEDHDSLTAFIGNSGYRQTSLTWEQEAAGALSAIASGFFDVAALDYVMIGARPEAWAREARAVVEAGARIVVFNAPDDAALEAQGFAWVAELPRIGRLDAVGFGALLDGRTLPDIDEVAARNWYQALVDVSAAYIAFVDPRLRVRAANDLFAEALGTSRAKLIGQSLESAPNALLVAELKARLSLAFAGTRTEEPGTLELMDGRRLDIMGTVCPCYGPDGQLLGAAVSLRDVSETLRHERDAARAREVQQAVVDLQYRFVSGASETELARRLLEPALTFSDGCFGVVVEVSQPMTPITSMSVCPRTGCGADEGNPCPGRTADDAACSLLVDRLVALAGITECTVDLACEPTADVAGVPGFQRVLAVPLHEGASVTRMLYLATMSREFPHDMLTRLEPIVTAYESVTSGSLAQRRQRDAEVRYRHLYDENPALLIEVSPHGMIQSVNEYGARIIGAAPDELVGTNFLEVLLPDDAVFGGQVLDTVFNGTDETTVAEMRLKHRDGTVVWMKVTGRVIGQETPPTALMVCKDISETRKLSDELAYFASHDVLTGLLNRREFERRIHLATSTADAQQRRHALVLLDLDMFRLVNDTAGHKAGDELLRDVGKRLSGALRSRDIVARIGGDEFGVLIRDCDQAQALRVAEELLTAVIRDPFEWREHDFRMNASAGVVPIDGAITDVGELMSTAEATCQEAKLGTANNIALSTGETSALKRRREEMQRLEQLRRALSTDAFELNAQVIRPSGGGSGPVHFEVLLRMLGDDGARISPGVFLPVAERYRLAQPLDRWVVSSVFAWFAARRELLDRVGVCSINLSGHSVGDPDMQDFIREQCMIHRVPADRFCFEVTETAMMVDIDRAISFIETLREDGFRFAIDDFGTGLASFGYLKRLPVDYVKIDGMFVKDIEEDDSHAAIVASINQISKVMGKQTIAEFVETEEIAKRLWMIGVDYVQGYGIGKPVPLDELGVLGDG